MTLPPDTNRPPPLTHLEEDSRGSELAGTKVPDPTLAPGKSSEHQIEELYRLVDDAMDNLEQVLRGLRFLKQRL